MRRICIYFISITLNIVFRTQTKSIIIIQTLDFVFKEAVSKVILSVFHRIKSH